MKPTTSPMRGCCFQFALFTLLLLLPAATSIAEDKSMISAAVAPAVASVYYQYLAQEQSIVGKFAKQCSDIIALQSQVDQLRAQSRGGGRHKKADDLAVEAQKQVEALGPLHTQIKEIQDKRDKLPHTAKMVTAEIVQLQKRNADFDKTIDSISGLPMHQGRRELMNKMKNETKTTDARIKSLKKELGATPEKNGKKDKKEN